MGNAAANTNQSQNSGSNNSSNDTNNASNSKANTENDLYGTQRVWDKGNYEITLVASALGGVTGFTAYHTSILVNGKDEYFFDDGGIHRATGTFSHSQAPGAPTKYTMGKTNRSPNKMYDKLTRYFESGSYDVLRKNCNSFSDCALAYLFDNDPKMRLPSQFCTMEGLGAKLATKFNSEYKPNPKADNFDKEKVILSLDPRKVFKTTQGMSVGGTNAANANSMDDVRAARLARFANMG